MYKLFKDLTIGEIEQVCLIYTHTHKIKIFERMSVEEKNQLISEAESWYKCWRLVLLNSMGTEEFIDKRLKHEI